ncbi:hypothetical protein EJA72_04615 [Pseudomonas sp. PB120]|uniref:hypothetical protein n=1 Tax=Pseudomonas sp. PB120 TaxID=2494700 RepID=UPI0012FE57D1|nr:hypothetical protein [Pseudomonas sp. PB120]MVV47536.1 hypothetical protein [Pseudomonas sp. PB120]
MSHQQSTQEKTDARGKSRIQCSRQSYIDELIDIIEQSDDQSKQLADAVLKLYQLIEKAAVLLFVEHSDTTVGYAFLDAVEALTALPSFTVDTPTYQQARHSARVFAGLLKNGRIRIKTRRDRG